MKDKITVRQAIKQIGRYNYYEAREKGEIAIYQPENRRAYHEQWQIDEYLQRMKQKALVPARVDAATQYSSPPRRVSRGVQKILNNPNLGVIR